MLLHKAHAQDCEIVTCTWTKRDRVSCLSNSFILIGDCVKQFTSNTRTVPALRWEILVQPEPMHDDVVFNEIQPNAKYEISNSRPNAKDEGNHARKGNLKWYRDRSSQWLT